MRHSTYRTRAVASTAVVAALLLSGCSGAATDAQDSATTEPSSPTSPTQTVQPAPATPTPTTTPSPSTTPSVSTTRKAKRTRTATSTTTRTRTATRTASPSASSSTTASPSPSTSPTLADDGKPLSMGAQSPRVLAAQQRLSSLGYFIPSPDGSYGGGTRQAVYALQKVAGLPRTGMIDAATKAALDRGVTAKSRTGRTGLEVDVDRQVALVVQGGRVTRVINVSTGNGETFRYPKKKDAEGNVTEWATEKATTPAGSFDIYFERNVLWESTLEIGSLYRPKYFNGGIAFHGASSVPPVPASHGCVRMTNAAMDWMWSSGVATKGTRVTVYGVR